MCQPLPGPRCASHARKTLLKAHRTEQYAHKAYENGEVEVETVKDVIRARMIAQLDYDSTPTGQQELQQQIKHLGFDNEHQAKLQERLEKAYSHRQSLVQCSRLHRSAQKALQESKESLAAHQAELEESHLLLTQEETALHQKALLLESSQVSLSQVQERIRQNYLQQGEIEKASTPVLWLYSNDIDPSLRNQWIKLRKEVKRHTDTFEEAQRTHARANACFQLSRLKIRMARAEIATGLEQNNSSDVKSYGQVYVNADGTTNARLLTKIPHTDTEVFARVRTLMDDHIILETGTKIRLKSRIAPSHWRFEAPSQDAVRGPQIFSMETSA